MTQSTSTPVAGSTVTPVAGKYDRLIGAFRIIQILFSIIVLGLVGAVTSANSSYCEDDYYLGVVCYKAATPSYWSFSLFAGAFTLILAIYLIVASLMPRFASAIAILVIDALLCVIWFVALILLAVWVGSFNTVYGTDGSDGGIARLEAATVFNALIWLSFIATLVLSLLGRRSARGQTVYANQPPVMQQAPPAQMQQAPVAQHPGNGSQLASV